MLFNSAISLFVFLPITVAGFHTAQRLAGRSAALTFLFAASLVFFTAGGMCATCCCCWGPSALIIGSVCKLYAWTCDGGYEASPG